MGNIGSMISAWWRKRSRIAGLLHLEDWRRTLNDKLTTLDSLYQILKQDQLSRLLLVLELSVVIIFLIDLVLVSIGLLISLKGP